MDGTFTTGLYIFSSLLQADAAILGLGAVFVIYRLQSLYTQEQSTIAILEKAGLQRVDDHLRNILSSRDPAKMKVALKDSELNFPGCYPSFKFLSEMDGLIDDAKKGFVPSLILVAIHCFLSALCLWWMSYVCVSQGSRFVQIAGPIVTFLFGAILIEVITAAQVALDTKPFLWPFPLGRRIWSKSLN